MIYTQVYNMTNLRTISLASPAQCNYTTDSAMISLLTKLQCYTRDDTSRGLSNSNNVILYNYLATITSQTRELSILYLQFIHETMVLYLVGHCRAPLGVTRTCLSLVEFNYLHINLLYTDSTTDS